MRKQLLLLAVLITTGISLNAQNVGINTASPDPSSELDVTSTNKGFLAPRMTQAQRDAISSPATGLLIYQTDGTAGFYVYDGSAWTPMNNPEGLFKSDGDKISYRNTGNFGKPFLVNTDTVDNIPSSYYSHMKLMFLPGKYGAFRAGYVNNKSWDIDSIGNGSFASGNNTRATGVYATAIGDATTASGHGSIAMGEETTASGYNATAMGEATTASGYNSTAIGYSAIASGYNATAIGSGLVPLSSSSFLVPFSRASGHSSVAMGGAMASGENSFAIGGMATASGNYAIAMGTCTKAAGNNATAIGSFAGLNSNASGSMYLSDAFRTDTTQTTTGTTSNRFYARFNNGYYLYTDGIGNYGIFMQHQGNSWSTISDSTKKENYKPAPDFLSKIAQMKIGSWNYKGQDKTQYRHYGPYAQEFYHHFGNDGVGTVGNDTTISSADIDGVMMIAIQQLIKENEQLKADNAILKAELDTQKTTTEARLSKLEALSDDKQFVQK